MPAKCGRSQALTLSLDNEAGSAFKGAKRVVLSQFGVEFCTQLVAIGRSGGNPATQTATLVGVAGASLQNLVDGLYADTVGQLKAAGSSGRHIHANMPDRLGAQNHSIGTPEADIAKELDATLLKFSILADCGITKASKNGLLATAADALIDALRAADQ